MPSPAPTILNKLLETLPINLRNRLQHSCETVDLEFGSVLCEPEHPFKYVYFPLTGFISLVAVVD